MTTPRSEISAPLPDVSRRGLLGRLAAGMGAAIAGVGWVLRDARLVVLSLVPMLVHVVLFGGLAWAGFAYVVDDAVAAVVALAPGGAKDVVDVVVSVLVGVGVVGVALVGSLVVGSVVCDPFYDLLSERTEELIIGRNVGPPLSVGSVVRGILREGVASVLRLGVWLAVALPLWLLSFTPLAILATPLSFVWTFLFVAYEYVSRSLARHAVEPGQRFRPLFAHKAVFVGFGAVAWVLSFLPFLAPIFVVAGTRLYLCLAVHDHAPSKFTVDEKARFR